LQYIHTLTYTENTKKLQAKNSKVVLNETNDEIKEEQQAMYDFAVERSTKDVHKPSRNGRRYFKGEDVYGCPFLDHQNKL
jgi:hypothetical protein